MSLAPALPFAIDRLRAGRRVGIRHVLDGAGWDVLATDPPPAGAALLLGLWADGPFVSALFHEGRHRPVVTSVMPEGLRYRGLSALLPAAIPWERRIRDLHGLEAMSAADLRPLLDHGLWANEAPLATPTGPPPRAPAPIEWKDGGEPEEGAVYAERGPAGTPIPGLRLRAVLKGEAVQRAELASGTLHRGLVAAAIGRTVAEAASLVERLDAFAAVAQATAFARAVEAATGHVPSPSSVLLRVVASEWERVVAVASLLSRAADSAGSDLLATRAMAMASFWRDVGSEALGHRFGAGFVRPGGVSRPIGADGVSALREACARLDGEAATLASLYAGRAGLAPLLAGPGGAARVSLGEALAGSAGGPVARASGIGFDARVGVARGGAEPFAPRSSTEEGGTADLRFRIRLASLPHSGARIRDALAALDGASDAAWPDGPPRPPGGDGHGIGVVEAPEGDLWHVLSVDEDGRVAGLFVRDPVVAHAALFERAARGVRRDLLPSIAHSFALRAEALDQ